MKGNVSQRGTQKAGQGRVREMVGEPSVQGETFRGTRARGSGSEKAFRGTGHSSHCPHSTVSLLPAVQEGHILIEEAHQIVVAVGVRTPAVASGGRV